MASPSSHNFRPGLEFDVDSLSAYLKGHLDGFEGAPQVLQFPGGQSNPTYLLTTPGHRYVLRRKPPGNLLPSAHAVDREYKVMRALCDHTPVPVARPLLLCQDATVIGTEFFVMEHVDGRILWNPALPEIPVAERAAHYAAMSAAIASICLRRGRIKFWFTTCNAKPSTRRSLPTPRPLPLRSRATGCDCT